MPAPRAPGGAGSECASGDWERHEGMLLRIAAPLTVIDHHAAPAHGQVQVAFDGRLWQPNERERPGSAAARELAVANSAAA